MSTKSSSDRQASKTDTPENTKAGINFPAFVFFDPMKRLFVYPVRPFVPVTTLKIIPHVEQCLDLLVIKHL